MFGIFYLVLISVLVFAGVSLFLYLPANKLAGMVKNAGPFGAILLGLLLTFAGRGVVGLPMIALGLAFWQRSRMAHKTTATTYNIDKNRWPIIRSAAVELEIDIDGQAMQGRVLTGTFEGRAFSDLRDDELISCLNEIGSDQESASLFEAYLDSRLPAWRQNPHLNIDPGHGSSSGSGPVTQEEAYQILGLTPRATAQEVSEAHRLLMKIMHPDNGGSTYIAARINAARDRLVD